jgi:hypothetical protein
MVLKSTIRINPWEGHPWEGHEVDHRAVCLLHFSLLLKARAA